MRIFWILCTAVSLSVSLYACCTVMCYITQKWYQQQQQRTVRGDIQPETCYRRCRSGVNFRGQIKTVNVSRSKQHLGQHGVNRSNLISVNVKTKQQAIDKVCVLLNARSVRNKTFTIKEHISDHNADFLFITVA